MGSVRAPPKREENNHMSQQWVWPTLPTGKQIAPNYGLAEQLEVNLVWEADFGPKIGSLAQFR